MPRKLIKRFLPDPNYIRKQKPLRIFGELLHDPNLWHLNRRSVSGAFAVGLFTAFVPIPFQMLLAAALAIPLRVNLLISVVLVWVSNPFTIPLLFYTAYKLGEWVIGGQANNFYFEPTIDWLATELSDVWQPFLLGCFLAGSSAAMIGYTGVRLAWRYRVLQNWKQRREKQSTPTQGLTDPRKYIKNNELKEGIDSNRFSRNNTSKNNTDSKDHEIAR